MAKAGTDAKAALKSLALNTFRLNPEHPEQAEHHQLWIDSAMSFRIGQPYGCDKARSAYNPLMPHVLLATLVVLHLSSAILAQERGNSAPVRVQMSYFAKPGKEDEVLQLRIKAAEILERAGVGRGRVWRLIESPRATKGESPTVMWEGEFASEAALKAYEEVADKNPDFLAARRQMTDLTVKFERRYFREGR